MHHSRTSFFILLFMLLVVMAALHLVGMEFFWYWQFAPFDIIVHTLAGAWISGMVLWGYYLSGYITPRNSTRFFIFITPLVVTLCVGVVWELFEITIDRTLIDTSEYVFDTITDLLSDAVGAIIASAYFLKTTIGLTRV